MSTQRIIRLSQLLSDKYLIKLANINAEEVRSTVEDSLWTALRNASTNSATGIMPFEKMAKEDGLTLTFDVTRNDGWGTKAFSVDNIVVSPTNKGHLAPKYSPLKQQIEQYLDKYWEVYPSSIDGKKLDYKNFVVNLSYNAAPPDNSSRVAAK